MDGPEDPVGEGLALSATLQLLLEDLTHILAVETNLNMQYERRVKQAVRKWSGRRRGGENNCCKSECTYESINFN